MVRYDAVPHAGLWEQWILWYMSCCGSSCCSWQRTVLLCCAALHTLAPRCQHDATESVVGETDICQQADAVAEVLVLLTLQRLLLRHLTWRSRCISVMWRNCAARRIVLLDSVSEVSISTDSILIAEISISTISHLKNRNNKGIWYNFGTTYNRSWGITKITDLYWRPCYLLHFCSTTSILAGFSQGGLILRPHSDYSRHSSGFNSSPWIFGIPHPRKFWQCRIM